MKKAWSLHKSKYLINILLWPCFFILNFCLSSCGIDTYIVVEAPIQTINSPTYSSIEHPDYYFEFWTYETPFKNSQQYPSDFKFLGTEVYYKIYSSSSTMVSETTTLESLASSSTSSASAPTRLTESYGYKSLKSTNYNGSPLIKPDSSFNNQKVYIRLTDYQSDEAYAAKITVNGNYLQDNPEKTIPIRNTSDHLSFNFGRKESNDKKPLSGDADVKYSSEPTDNKWYVAMFAVAIGRDASYTTFYSNILYLGSVPIDAESEDN